MSNQEKLEQFAAVTGCTDETKGFGLLEAAGWDVATAIELFFASEGDTGPAPPPQTTAEDPSERLARQLQEEDQEATRAPLPTKTERLYADIPDFRGQPVFVGAQRERSSRQQQKPPVDAFRDFKSEGEGSSKGSAQGPGLADLFSAPSDITFPGSFDQAKNKAAVDDKWLLVNIQSGSEFASHQLNRDTWKNDTVRDLVAGMFVFFQIYEHGQEAPRLINSYRVVQLPITMVVDPITGACLFQKHGFISPETLADHLVPYLDHGPSHAGAASLAQSRLKRKLPEKPLTEEEELARAIAASMDPNPTSSTDAADRMLDAEDGGDDDDDEVQLQAALDRRIEEEKAAAQANRPPEEVMAEAEARLPPPPVDSDPAATRLAIRLPDGSRVMRAFSRTDPLSALYDFCITQVQEAAAGRPFSLVLPMPGAQPLTDKTFTLEAAGLVNAMLVLKWQD